jgi:hypothetical protein
MGMKDKFENNLKRIISQLPQHTPDDHIWRTICNELDYEEMISRKIKTLPSMDHEKDLWVRIEHKLNQHAKVSGKKSRRMITWSISIAASVALIVAFFTRKSDIVFSEEYRLEESFICTSHTRTADPLDFLRQLCKYSEEECADPVFESEMRRLVELDAEIKHLHKIIDAYGESPSLIKSLITMENQKAGLVKELLKTLRT